MSSSFNRALAILQQRCGEYGVEVRVRELDEETPAVFDGLGITLSTRIDTESRCYYLVHSLGSIVEWSLDLEASRGVYGELREAKKVKEREPSRFEAALAGFLQFEEVASQYAVWILGDTGHSELVDPYTVFARADAEAMVRFHREGVAPVWTEFFPAFKAQVASGERIVRPYTPARVPPFEPVEIPKQDVVKEEDGKP